MIKDILNYNISAGVAEEISANTGIDVDELLYNTDQLKYNSLSTKKLNKQQRRDLEKRVKKFEDQVNRKIEREIRKYSGNPEAQKMVFREVKKGLANAEKYSDSYKMVIPDSVMEDIIDGKASAEMKIINKNFSHNEEKLIERMKISIDFDKIQTRQDYSLVAQSLGSIRDRASLMTHEVADGVYTTIKERDKLAEMVKSANLNKMQYQKELADSAVEGHPDIFFTASNADFSLRGVHDYRSYVNRINQIAKYSDPNYYKNRADIYKQNYLKAVYDELPLDKAMEIENIIEDSNWVDFMKLAETHPAARIDYMYASGSQQGDLIIQTLRNNL